MAPQGCRPGQANEAGAQPQEDEGLLHGQHQQPPAQGQQGDDPEAVGSVQQGDDRQAEGIEAEHGRGPAEDKAGGQAKGAEEVARVMGHGQEARVLQERQAQGHAQGQEADEQALAQQEAYLANIFDSQSSAFYTSGHLLDDGMIDPRDTRRTLAFLLETVWETRHRSVRPNSFGIARM